MQASHVITKRTSLLQVISISSFIVLSFASLKCKEQALREVRSLLQFHCTVCWTEDFLFLLYRMCPFLRNFIWFPFLYFQTNLRRNQEDTAPLWLFSSGCSKRTN